MAAYSNVVGHCGYVNDDQTRGSTQDLFSTTPGPTSLKGSWNPSTDIVSQPTEFFPTGSAPSEPTIAERIIARLKEAGLALFFPPSISSSDLADSLAKWFYFGEERHPEGGHDVRLLLADCLAELNDSILSPKRLCRCTNSTDDVSKANAFFSSLSRGRHFYYGEVYHIHGTPADLYVVQFMATSCGPTVNSRPRLTPFGALSELPSLLPENKTKEQLEAIDAMYELIGSPWKVWL